MSDMTEREEEKIQRLELMISDDSKWDLSNNDCEAISYALTRIRDLEAKLTTVLQVIKDFQLPDAYSQPCIDELAEQVTAIVEGRER